MTRKRYTEEQIIAVLKDARAGASVSRSCDGSTGSRMRRSIRGGRNMQVWKSAT